MHEPALPSRIHKRRDTFSRVSQIWIIDKKKRLLFSRIDHGMDAVDIDIDRYIDSKIAVKNASLSQAAKKFQLIENGAAFRPLSEIKPNCAVGRCFDNFRYAHVAIIGILHGDQIIERQLIDKEWDIFYSEMNPFDIAPDGFS